MSRSAMTPEDVAWIEARLGEGNMNIGERVQKFVRRKF